jgi:hypothetical protein
MNHASSGAADFDFLHGQWQVRHRRLRQRLAGCQDWDQFEGRCQAWPLLGGAGNVDDNVLELPGGTYRAATLRTFDAQTGQWSIWWIDGRNPQQLDVPVRGRFVDGVGEFFAEDELAGRPIRVRFRWTRLDAETARWEQAFSPDGGASWETNWEMDFLRQSPTQTPR